MCAGGAAKMESSFPLGSASNTRHFHRLKNMSGRPMLFSLRTLSFLEIWPPGQFIGFHLFQSSVSYALSTIYFSCSFAIRCILGGFVCFTVRCGRVCWTVHYGWVCLLYCVLGVILFVVRANVVDMCVCICYIAVMALFHTCYGLYSLYVLLGFVVDLFLSSRL